MEIVCKQQITRSGRISYPYLGIAYMQKENNKGRYLKPYYYNSKSMIQKLGTSIYYQELYFADNITVKELKSQEIDAEIKR